MVPYVYKVKDIVAQWLLVSTWWHPCTSLYSGTLTCSWEDHPSTWQTGTHFINAWLLLYKVITSTVDPAEIFLCYLQWLKHKVRMKLSIIPMKRSTAISEHLKTVEFFCQVVDNTVLKVMKFLYAFNICKRTCNAPNSLLCLFPHAFICNRQLFSLVCFMKKVFICIKKYVVYVGLNIMNASTKEAKL
jgi:hypothetical protein